MYNYYFPLIKYLFLVTAILCPAYIKINYMQARRVYLFNIHLSEIRDINWNWNWNLNQAYWMQLEH